MALNNNTESFRDEDAPRLNLPYFELKLKREGESVKVYDRLRDKFVVLTPEEYVRQHFVNYLITGLGYPPSIMANEIGIELNGTKQRCDTIIVRPDGKPDIIVEYKSPEVAITQNVFDQIVRYNMKLHARYLIVSNGLKHYCCKMDYQNDTYYFIHGIPAYDSIANPYSQN